MKDKLLSRQVIKDKNKEDKNNQQTDGECHIEEYKQAD